MIDKVIPLAFFVLFIVVAVPCALAADDDNDEPVGVMPELKVPGPVVNWSDMGTKLLYKLVADHTAAIVVAAAFLILSVGMNEFKRFVDADHKMTARENARRRVGEEREVNGKTFLWTGRDWRRKEDEEYVPYEYPWKERRKKEMDDYRIDDDVYVGPGMKNARDPYDD